MKLIYLFYNAKKNPAGFDLIKSLQSIGLPEKEIKLLAYQTGFMKRRPKKIDALCFLANICSVALQFLPSYNNLASQFHIAFHVHASKQAFWKRVNTQCVRFFQAILEKLILLKYDNEELSIYRKSCVYSRVLVQDSTIIKLPTRLYAKFSGVKNAHYAVCNARVQGVYDLISGCFVSFSIDPYSKNDLASAPEMQLQDGDLVLRDRGYYTKNEMQRHLDNGADCIYRYKHKTLLLDPTSGIAINLFKELEKKEKLDMEVLLNNKEKTKVRLVAMPVPEDVANKRRRKAIKESCSKGKLSQEVLKLMSWTIFLTTIPIIKADFDELAAIYRMRWRIEILFKIWKSHMNFAQVHNVSENQLNIIMLSRLILIVICMNFVYYPFYFKVRQRFRKHLSMTKLVNYLMLNQNILKEIVIATRKSEYEDAILSTLMRYCTYDTRKRLNHCQLLELALLS